MNFKTLLIVCIVAVVLIGGAGFFMLFMSNGTPATSNGNSQTGAQNYGGSNQTSVTVPSTPKSAPVDIPKEYATLFNTLAAQSISFTTVGADATGDMAGVYALYSADIAAVKKMFPAATRLTIDVALVDLNEDGTPEALVSENLPGYCGSGGCPLDIYRKVKGKWVALYNTLAAGTVGQSNTYTGGYADLFLSIHGDLGYLSNVIRYTWDGTQYQPKNTVARWDGQTFQMVQ